MAISSARSRKDGSFQRVLITGASGFVGKNVFMELASSEELLVFGLGREEGPWVNLVCDITDKAALFKALDSCKPDVIVHAAAWPDVEGCEKDKDKARLVNVEGTRNVCEYARAKNCKVIFISTDYVYSPNDGKTSTEESETGAFNFYTETKLEGEKLTLSVQESLVLRTGFIYGIDPGGMNFLMQMLSGRDLTVASDQKINPTSVKYLSEAVAYAVLNGLFGIYNCSGRENLSRGEFARMIQKEFSLSQRITERRTAEMGYVTKRPLSVIVDSSKIYAKIGKPHPSIGEALAEMRITHDSSKISTFRRDSCRGCGAPARNVQKVFSYGEMPVANSFQFFPDLNAIPLEVMFCSVCSLVQIWDVVYAESLFSDYRYLSSVSPALQAHFLSLASTLKERLSLSEASSIVEIGSNDGVFQSGAKQVGLRVLGVEPARNVAALAQKDGHETIVGFFNRKTASELKASRGPADLIVGCNVLAHIDDMQDVLGGVRELLKEEGTLVFEVHYVVDLVKNKEYDNIYHEHVNEYSLTAISKMLARSGLVLSDVEHIRNHGGSLRVYARKHGAPSEQVVEMLALEAKEGFTTAEIYREFFSRIGAAKAELFSKLNALKLSGKRVACYGASARGTIFANYCNIGLNLVDFVVDKSKEKQGRFTPKNALPIFHPDELVQRNPDAILLLAYTYFDEIMKEQAWYSGTWIVPLPKYRELAGRGELK